MMSSEEEKSGMSYDSHHHLHMHFKSSQVAEPDRESQGSTCGNSFNQPDYYPNASAPMKRRTSCEEETGNSRKKRVLGRFSNHFDSQVAHHHHHHHHHVIRHLPMISPVPRLNQTMNQQHQFTMSNRVAQGSTNQQPFGMQQQPMMYQPLQQFMRHETNHQNQTDPKLASRMIMDDLMMLLHRYPEKSGGLGSLVVEQNLPMNMQQQPCPNAAPWTDPNSYYFLSQAKDLYRKFKMSQCSTVSGSVLQQFSYPNQHMQQQMHPQTQPMQSHGFNIEPSSYRGRGGWRGHRGRARGHGRRSQNQGGYS